jgi:hypothetical protein
MSEQRFDSEQKRFDSAAFLSGSDPVVVGVPPKQTSRPVEVKAVPATAIPTTKTKASKKSRALTEGDRAVQWIARRVLSLEIFLFSVCESVAIALVRGTLPDLSKLFEGVLVGLFLIALSVSIWSPDERIGVTALQGAIGQLIAMIFLIPLLSWVFSQGVSP